MKNVVYFLSLISLFSCLKEEEPIQPADRGGVKIGGIDINNNSDYSKQIYYEMESNKVVRTINRTSWDLGFESTPTGINIITNTSCKMLVAKTGETDFGSVTDLGTMTLSYDWDDASGNPDSLALRDWINSGTPSNEVFVIDRGEKPSLAARGFKKIKIKSVSSTEFIIEYANINGSDFHTKTITKNSDKNYTSFSFEEGGKIVEIEPDKNDWDLVFTQFLTTYYDFVPQINYSVNGLLINNKQCKGVKVFDKNFSGISISDISRYSLTDSANVIGYNWKFYNFSEATYSVVPSMNYIIQNNDGFYYKMRMIDFYSKTGIKGSPRFEFEKL
jgi:hypothetical protein